MQKTIKSIFSTFIIVLVLGTTGCGSKSSKKVSQAALVHNQIQNYLLFVQGVECKFCAQTVLDVLHKLPGVRTAQYHTTDDTYQDSYVSFTFDHELGQVPLDVLKDHLIKEGFTLVSIKNRSSESASYPLSGSTLIN